MKSLQNYGVQELDTRELQTIDGGIAPWVIIAVVLWVASTQEAN
jgi:lactobin A/cerein 7B family class IIb bacteriocin